MISPSKKQFILEMAAKNAGLREISRTLQVSRNTVREIIRNGDAEHPEKESKYVEHLPIIKELFKECRGNVVRVAEELDSRHGILIPYQTLTWIIRKFEIRTPKKTRSGEHDFAPGEEMQHDTSPHKIVLGGEKVIAQCASLVLAYSRKIFIQYYPRFTRFECKVFLATAFAYMDGVCEKCVIDNTHVVVASGVGPCAVINPEMEHFGGLYGTRFKPHRINDPNRKARVERPFYFVETNFIAGRTFDDWQDLNRQALAWCNEKSNPKHKRSLGMSPDAAYIIEKPSLKALPPFTPPVYQSFCRGVDIQGYVQLETNRYSVPHALVGKKLEVQKHWDKVLVYDKQKLVAEHKRIIDKNETRATLPNHHPPLNSIKSHQGPTKEERLLLEINNEELTRYVANLKERSPGRGVLNLRRLLSLQRTYPCEPFIAAVRTALNYGLYDLARLERMILNNIAGDFFEL
jgi:transposase